MDRFSCFSDSNLHGLDNLWTAILNPLQEKKKKKSVKEFFFARLFWQKHRQNVLCDSSKEPHWFTDHKSEEKFLKNEYLTDFLVKNLF